MANLKQETSRKTFDHLVELAALELSEDESDYLLAELNNQISAIHELEAIEIAKDVPPASHGVSYTPESSPPLRKDNWDACEDAQAIIEQSPVVDDGFIIVPDIPHTTLE
jgi:aspartyl-tRNA(Asn)/glutamyl-tRNA(Gln) amidotransferase subunit C